jgi:hypothetical protein
VTFWDRGKTEVAIRLAMDRTSLPRSVVRVSRELAIELSRCTTLSPATTWKIVERFLLVFSASYRMMKATGIDPTYELMDHVMPRKENEDG